MRVFLSQGAVLATAKHRHVASNARSRSCRDCRIQCGKTSLIAAAPAASNIKLGAATVEPLSASSHAAPRPLSAQDRVWVAAAPPAEARWAATQRRFRPAGCRLSIQVARLALQCLGYLQLQLLQTLYLDWRPALILYCSRRIRLQGNSRNSTRF